MKKIDIPIINNPIFSTCLNVRVSDLNYANHLGHDSFISLMHEARVQFLKSLGFTELNAGGFGILVINLVVNYKAEAFYGDKINIDLGMGEITNTRVDFYYELKNTDTAKMIATAATTIVFYDFQQEKVTKVPEVFLEVVK